MNFPLQLLAAMLVLCALFCGAEYGFSQEDAAVAESVSQQIARLP